VAIHDVLTRILSDGFCSRLPRRLREELGLVYDVSAHVTHLDDVGTIDVRASVRFEHFEAFFGALYHELRSIAERGPTEEETDRSVLRAVVDVELAPAAASDVASRIAWDVLCERSTSLTRERGSLESVTADEVRRVAAASFRSDRAALVVIGPRAPGIEQRLHRGLVDSLPGDPGNGS
jgi:zinc protease